MKFHCDQGFRTRIDQRDRDYMLLLKRKNDPQALWYMSNDNQDIPHFQSSQEGSDRKSPRKPQGRVLRRPDLESLSARLDGQRSLATLPADRPDGLHLPAAPSVARTDGQNSLVAQHTDWTDSCSRRLHGPPH